MEFGLSSLEMSEFGATLMRLSGVALVPRTQSKKKIVRLSVSLDETEYAQLSRIGAALDQSAAWMIRRAISEFVTRNRQDVPSDLPLRRPEAETRGTKKVGS